jgi:hypothetical protein
VGRVAGTMRKKQRTLLAKPEGKCWLRKKAQKGDNIKRRFKNIWSYGVDSIHLTQDSD